MAHVKYDISNEKAIAATLAKWVGRTKAVKMEGQQIVLSMMEKMDKDGDFTSGIVPLVAATKKAFGNGLQLAMIEYILAYTWLAYDEDSKTFSKDRSKKMDLEGAKAKNWFEMERPTKVSPFDAQKAVQTLIARALKAHKDSGFDMTDLHSQFEAEFNKAVPAEKAETVTTEETEETEEKSAKA